MLTPSDDYPIHQTSEPVAHTAQSSMNEYDRHFFNGYTRDGSLNFGAAPGVDPVYLHVQQVVLAGERVDVGVFEQLVLGPHGPSGFTDLFDGAH